MAELEETARLQRLKPSSSPPARARAAALDLAVWRMWKLECKTQREIADMLGVSKSRVHQRRNRGAMLVIMMAKQDGDL